jgi:hypothetical protein
VVTLGGAAPNNYRTRNMALSAGALLYIDSRCPNASAHKRIHRSLRHTSTLGGREGVVGVGRRNSVGRPSDLSLGNEREGQIGL